ncbi:MAG: hypothetical protein JKX69_00955 [Rhodobacteraceae bacterium]|nr:hypothetical protein [Paracoccaceae bacterium]
MQKPGQQFDTMLAQPGEDDDIDLLAIFRTLWRGKILILFCVLLALVAGWYQAYRVATPIYSSTAQMALLLRSEQLIDLDSVISGVSGDEYSMNTEMEVIRSRDLVGRLVDQLGLIDDPEFNSTLPQPERAPSLGALVSIGLDKLRMVLSPPEPDSGTMPDEATIRRRVIDAVRSRISPQTREWSYIFTITVTSQSREKSALMANTMAAIYRDDQIRIKVEATENAAIWLAERVSQLQLELEQQQSAANALRAANALVSSEGLQALNAQALELRQLLHVAQGQLIRLEAQSAALTAVDGTSSIEARLAAASDAQLEAIAASVTAGDTSARARFDRRYAQILLQAQTDRSRLGQQVGELSAADRDLSQQLSQQSEEFQKLQLLDREAEATRILYETFLTRLKETRCSKACTSPIVGYSQRRHPANKSPHARPSSSPRRL